MDKEQTGNVIQFSSKHKHKCSCDGNCEQGHHNGEFHPCRCDGHIEQIGEPHGCGCKHKHKVAPTTDRVRIHLESRSAEHCNYILMIDDQRAIKIALEKFSDKIVVKLDTGEDVPDDVKDFCEAEVRTYDNINAQQFVEIYDESEDLISELMARVLSVALLSGVLEQIEPIVLADGWEQRQFEFEGNYYSIVTHPRFDVTLSFGCSCLDDAGYYKMTGLKI